MDLLHKFSTKCRQHAKMENDDDFIPRSARLMNFEFMVSKQVECSEEFLGVKVETEALVKEFRLNLKGKIIEILKMCRRYSTLFRTSSNFKNHINIHLLS